MKHPKTYVEYTKPHLTYNEQVDRLRERGLAVPDEAAAVRLLRTVGYYRLSAYVYPFRVLLPAGAREKGHTRSEDLVEGASIDHVRDLWEFDRRLRLLVLDGAEVIEVGLRAQLAYVLGRRDTFGHLNEASLDQQRCNKPRTVQGQKRRAFERWLARYEELRQRARLEPFVLYNSQKYGPDKLPVWVAVEFLDFGAAIRLYDLLHDDDRNEIARAMGFKTGATLHPVLLACSNTRNTAAHHGRLWNRPAISTPRAKIYDAGPMLDGWASLKHNYMYAQLLLMAYLTRHIDPTSRWPIHVRERLSKFPELPGIELHTDMGVPQGWQDLPVWKDQPKFK